MLSRRRGFAAAPIVLGLVLGPPAEVNSRRALIIFHNDVTPLVTPPYSALFLFLTALGLPWPHLRERWVGRAGKGRPLP